MPTRRTAISAAAALAGAAIWPISTGCAPSPDVPGAALSAPLIERLDGAVRQAMDEAGIPGAVVGVWSPQGEYVRAFGIADTAAATPMTSDAYTRIGSVTKTFTGTALLQLVDAGRVGLDRPIARYLGGVPGGHAITVRQLATMRSGLVDYSETRAFAAAVEADPARQFTPTELLAFAFAEPAAFEPGERWAYTNTNYVILGLLIEKVSGKGFGQYLAEHILRPLGLQHTSFPSGTLLPEPHPHGYTDPAAPGQSPMDATGFSASMTGAAGAMVSTLADMRIWVPAVAEGALISPAAQTERVRNASGADLPPPNSYGIGLLNASGWIGHNGSVPGYQTVAVYLPPRRMTLVVFVNTDIAAPDGGIPGSAVAGAVTAVLSPEHVYRV